jgi:hypothetical protein
VPRLLLALAGSTCLAAGAAPPSPAAEHVRIGASFSPYRLGAPAAMTLSMTVRGEHGQLPAPLTAIDIAYPPALGIATSGLGTATCVPAVLAAHGPGACPRDSLMGRGSAQARFRIGPSVFSESASIAILAAPSADGRLQLLISATGLVPVAARIVMASTLLDGHFSVAVPLVPSLPEGEDVAVVSVRATLGGALRYSERRRGRTVYYAPRGGFRFHGRFGFADATSAYASTMLPCPRR